jgi:mRNA interferase RelE/StbE
MSDIVVYEANAFRRAYKKLTNAQQDDVDSAVANIVINPAIGEQKRGDLHNVYVHKFKSNHQLILLAYRFDPASRTLLLLGSHENFYRELKR